MLVQDVAEYNQFLEQACSDHELTLLTLRAATKTQFLVRHDPFHKIGRSLLKHQPDIDPSCLVQPVGNVLLPEFSDAEYAFLDPEGNLVLVTGWFYENFARSPVRHPITHFDPVAASLWAFLCCGLCRTPDEAAYRLSTLIPLRPRPTPDELQASAMTMALKVLNLDDLAKAADVHLRQAHIMDSSVLHRTSSAIVEKIARWLGQPA